MYDLKKLPERVAEARVRFKDYITNLERAYAARHRASTVDDYVVAFLGPAQAGKDQCGLFLSQATRLQYGGSTSKAVLPMIAWGLGKTEDEAYAERIHHRPYWFEWCNEYRKDDPTALARLNLSASDIVVGVRGLTELHYCVRERVIHFSVWVDNPLVERDPTIEYGPEVCSFTVHNHGTLEDLRAEVERLASALRLK